MCMCLFTACAPHQTVHSQRAGTVPVLLEALPLALNITAFLAERHAMHPLSPSSRSPTPEEGWGKPFINVIEWPARHTHEGSWRNCPTTDSADYCQMGLLRMALGYQGSQGQGDSKIHHPRVQE